MGEVYRARDPRLEREVAIKVLPADLLLDAERLSRFEQEAKAASALNHLNILTVHDIGVHAGRPYLVTARAMLDSLEARSARSYVPAYWFALVHVGLGETEKALTWLERAYQERSTVLAYLRIDPRLDPLHEDPRFVALLQRLGGE